MPAVLQVHIKREKKQQRRQRQPNTWELTRQRWFPVLSNQVFVPRPATVEAARPFQEPGEEGRKADLNLPSHCNRFLLNWSSDKHLWTMSLLPSCSPLALSTHTNKYSTAIFKVWHWFRYQAFFLNPAHSKWWTSMLASYTIKISHLSDLWINWDLNIKIVAGFSIIFSLDLTLSNNCNFSNVSIRLLCICPCYISASAWRLTSGGTNWMSHDHEVDSGDWGAECWTFI